MPTPKMPEPEWTEDDVQAARRRGKKVALEFFGEHPGVEMVFAVEEAAELMEREGLFQDGSPKRKAAMVFELHDFAHRFAAELREVSA